MAKLKFLGVFGEMLLRDMNVRASDASLHVFPEVFESIHMGVASDIFTRSVINRLVFVALGIKTIVRTKFVRMNRRTSNHILFNDGMKVSSGNGWNYFRHYLAVPLKHPENDGLSSGTTTASSGTLAANIGFINLNLSKHGKLSVNFLNVLSDLIRNTPSALIGYSKLSLQFLCRNTVTRCGEKIDGIKPELKRCAAILKRRSDRWMKMMSAPLAGISAFRLNLIPVGFSLALRARMALSESDVENVLQASIVRWKLLEEIAYRNARLFFFPLVHAYTL